MLINASREMQLLMAAGLCSDGYVLLIPYICNLLGKWESVCFGWVKGCPWYFLVKNPRLWEATECCWPSGAGEASCDPPTAPVHTRLTPSDSTAVPWLFQGVPEAALGTGGSYQVMENPGGSSASVTTEITVRLRVTWDTESTWNLPAALKEFCLLVWHRFLLIQPLDELWAGYSDSPQRRWSQGVWAPQGPYLPVPQPAQGFSWLPPVALLTLGFFHLLTFPFLEKGEFLPSQVWLNCLLDFLLWFCFREFVYSRKSVTSFGLGFWLQNKLS